LKIDKNEIKFDGVIEDLVEYESGICIRLGTFSKGKINNEIMNNIYMIDFEGTVLIYKH
jgi:hypothetical protein